MFQRAQINNSDKWHHDDADVIHELSNLLPSFRSHIHQGGQALRQSFVLACLEKWYCLLVADHVPESIAGEDYKLIARIVLDYRYLRLANNTDIVAARKTQCSRYEDSRIGLAFYPNSLWTKRFAIPIFVLSNHTSILNYPKSFVEPIDRLIFGQLERFKLLKYITWKASAIVNALFL